MGHISLGHTIWSLQSRTSSQPQHVHFYSRFGCRKALVDDLWFWNPEHCPVSITGILLIQIWLWIAIPLSIIESMYTKKSWTEDDGGYRGKCFVATSWKVLMQHTEATASRLPPCVVVSFEPMPNPPGLPLQVCDWLDAYLIWNFVHVLWLLILDVMFFPYCKDEI